MKIEVSFISNFDMMKFAFRLVLFTPILMLIGYIEFGLSKIENSYSYKKRNFLNRINDIEVLYMGSSQIGNAINPDYLDGNSFVLSNFSQTLYYDAKLIEQYLDKLPKLKLVCFGIGYESLGDDLYYNSDNWRCYGYSQEWGIDHPEMNFLTLGKYSKLILYTPKASIGYMLSNFNVDLKGDYLENGHYKEKPSDNRERINEIKGKARARIHEQSYKKERVLINKAYLEDVIIKLRKRNIEVVFITPPTYETYNKHLKESILESNREVLNYFEQKYNIKYYNYSKDTSFTLREYYDNDHLNSDGAIKFSRILNKEISKVITN